MKGEKNNNGKAWIVSVDMGYGHQRAAYPLKRFAYGGKIINASNYPGMPKKDHKIWQDSRKFYEFVSRFKKVPFFGELAFDLYDKVQEIPSFYPKRDLSKTNFQQREIFSLIKKRQWGKHFIERLDKKPLPLITTFFIPAFMAEVWGYGGDIYCVICDADISRAWVPLDPTKSRIRYLASNYRVVERLKLYGIKTENIFLTGFPLPEENIGGESLDILKHDLAERLIHLDPENSFIQKYKLTIAERLGKKWPHSKSNRPPTITFAVGGAGAQRELGVQIVKNLSSRIKANEIKIILVAGIRNEVNQYFRDNVKRIGLGKNLDKNIKIIFANSKDEYFKKFNKALRETDILWTKPSELSFYTALGLPIIMSTPIGSQEKFNRKWLMSIGSGTDQEDVQYVNEWLFDWMKSGFFARLAMQGFLEGGKYGTYNIEKIIKQKTKEMKTLKAILQY